MWLLRLMMRAPRPLARAAKRLSCGAASTWMSATFSSSMLAAVVDGDGDAHHLRHYHGAARPGLDRLAVVLGGGHLHLPGEVQVDERAFLQRAWHTGLD